MNLEDCSLSGSALTEPFLRDGLATVAPVRVIRAGDWEDLRESLRTGGAQRVHLHVTTRLASALGYSRPTRQHQVTTREGQEDGGWLLRAPNGATLRAWSIPTEADLDAPERSVRAYRASPTRIAQRVLLSRAEPAGLLTNGDVIRLLLCDPARSDSHLSIAIGTWSTTDQPPDSFRILQTLAGAANLPRLPTILEAARLHQARVTTELRRQAREAIVGFINALPDRTACDPATLWREGLILVYRLLFILKLECPAEATDGFSFAATRLWRDALSPNRALG
ncbi:MAG TPA: hypothetical protein VHU42_02680, partial [Rhodopila sp.]|nr:hypothetical protein [Rhodopila sp.]